MELKKKTAKGICLLFAGLMLFSLTSCGGGFSKKLEKKTVAMEKAVKSGNRVAFEKAVADIEAEITSPDDAVKYDCVLCKRGKEEAKFQGLKSKDYDKLEAIFDRIYEAAFNAPAQSEDCFEFKLSDDGTGVVITMYLSECPYVVIPEQIQGMPVVGVLSQGSRNVFCRYPIRTLSVPGTVKQFDPWCDSNDSLMAVNLKEGVETIGTHAFYRSYNLTKINIPSTVKSIGQGAFAGCENLESITLPEGITVIPEGAFYKCKKLTKVNIPLSVKMIDEEAFRSSGILEAKIPNGVEWLGFGAFSFCDNLKSISLPSSVKYIMGDISSHYTVAEYCLSLEELNFENGFNPSVVLFRSGGNSSSTQKIAYTKLFNGAKIDSNMSVQKMLKDRSADRDYFDILSSDVGKEYRKITDRRYDSHTVYM